MTQLGPLFYFVKDYLSRKDFFYWEHDVIKEKLEFEAMMATSEMTTRLND